MKKTISVLLSILMFVTSVSVVPYTALAMDGDSRAYYQYIDVEYNKADKKKFAKDKQTGGAFSAVSRDFDGDGYKDFVVFSMYYTDDTPYIDMDLFEIDDDGYVVLKDTVTLYVNGYGYYLRTLCAELKGNKINIYNEVASSGYEQILYNYMMYTVKNGKFVCKKDFQYYYYSRYDDESYKEKVSGAKYKSQKKFYAAVKKSGFNVNAHGHMGYLDRIYKRKGDNYAHNKQFKGKHLFTAVRTNGYPKNGFYGFLNDNTGFYNKINEAYAPNRTAIKKLKAKKKAFFVKWKKISGATGYQIQYSAYKSFKKSKTVTVKNAKTLAKTLRTPSRKTTYYVRIRTYARSNGKNYYSGWSAAKAVKVK